MNHRDIREACCEANRRLPATDLVDLTFGHVSVIDRKAGVFAIKPSGVDYADLEPSQMVIVDLDGNVVEGDLRPSSDTRPTVIFTGPLTGSDRSSTRTPGMPWPLPRHSPRCPVSAPPTRIISAVTCR